MNLTQHNPKSWKKQKGQGMAEYALIVALVAIASIAILTIFGDQIRDIFRASSKQLGGDESQQVTPQGSPDSEVSKSLDNF